MRMTNAVRTTAPPPAVPAIRATLLLDELLDELLELEVGEAVVVAVAVADMPAVDDGELALRHEESLDPKTCSNPETPPCLPAESVTKYRRIVPVLTFTTELKVKLFTEFHTNGCPPGISCVIVTGRTAPLAPLSTPMVN